MKINELKEQFGAIAVNDREFVLVQQAYLASTPLDTRPYYEALAVCAEDVLDEYGYQPCYRTRWDVLDEYVEFDDAAQEWRWTKDAQYRGEDEYCDWDAPDIVAGFGTYSTDEMRWF